MLTVKKEMRRQRTNHHPVNNSRQSTLPPGDATKVKGSREGGSQRQRWGRMPPSLWH